MMAAEPQWQWPVDTKFGMTGGFTEFRSGRFHAGVDFSIGGVEGLRLRPARDGRVFKVRADQTGYGRVVYMRHSDGSMTVYAHMAAFGDKLSNALKKLGKTPSSYFGLINLDLPLSTKDTLGFAGESGAGLPHLHFEVRDAQNRPLDPLDQNFPKLDMQSKIVIRGLNLIPQGDDAQVNHQPIAQHLPWNGQSATFQAQGRLGLQVDVHLTGARGSRMPVRGLRLKRAGTLIGEWQAKRVDYAQNYLAPKVYDQVHSGFGPTQYHYCFDARATQMAPLDGYQFDGAFSVNESTSFQLEVRDFFGKWHTYNFTLDPKTPAQSTRPVASPIQATSLRIVPQHNLLWLQANSPGQLEMGIDKQALAANTWLPFQPRGDAWVWRTEAGAIKRQVGLLSGRQKTEIGAWQLTAPSAPNDLATSMVLLPADRDSEGNRITLESNVLRFGREGWPVGKQDMQLVFQTGSRPKPQQLGFYYWAVNKAKWRYIKTEKRDGQLKAEVGHFMPLVVARDSTPPKIEGTRQATYYVGTRYVIPIEDEASGIDPDGIQLSRNGKAIAFDYDRDRGWLVLPAKVANGSYRVQIRDRSGNIASANVSVP